MPTRPERAESLLLCMQRHAGVRGTNAYQIAKATGLPLRSIQLLMRQERNPSLSNIEVIFSAMGLRIYVQEEGPSFVRSAKRPVLPSAP